MIDCLEIFVDGASQGNPGPAAIGVLILQDGQRIKEISQTLGETTNNVAEYQALLHALKEAQSFNAQRLKIYTDSQLMFSQLTGQYKVKNTELKLLFDKAQALAKNFKHIEICHIPREKNQEADKLATQALKKKLATSTIFKQVKMVASTYFHVGEESPSSKG